MHTSETSVIRRWRASRTARPGLDYLLDAPKPDAPLVARVRWLEELSAFIRTPPRAARPAGSGEGAIGRVRMLISLLERNPERARSVGAALRSLLAQLDSVDLFSSAGLTGDMGLGAELSERLWFKLLPSQRVPQDFGDLLHRLFPTPEDSAWLLALTATDMVKIATILAVDPEEWRRDLREAIGVLASKARVIAAFEEIRLRLPSRRPTASAFHDLDAAAARITSESTRPTAEDWDRIAAAQGRCDEELRHLEATFRERGSSFSLTYQAHRLAAILARIRTLATYWVDVEKNPLARPALLAQLAGEAARRHEMLPLWTDVTRTVAHRIADANAETGDHYITKGRGDYFRILGAALGGGVITVVTIFGKIASEHSELAPLLKGLSTAMIYAVSFLVIQAFDFTLATKQPAMTAATLARTLDGDPGPARIVLFAKELVNLVRTQIATIFGNLFGVACGVSLAWSISTRLLGHTPMSADDAHHLIESHSIFGLSPLFAAYCGLALWASSIMSGWAANLLRFRRVADSIGDHRRVRIALGETKAKRFAQLFEHGAPAAVGNVGLGLLLAFVPRLVSGFGLPLEARHITLASGGLTLAFLCGGGRAMSTGSIAAVAAGLVAIGALNLGVSFGLAIVVATKARNIPSAQRRMLRRAIMAQVLKSPLSLVLPMRGAARSG